VFEQNYKLFNSVLACDVFKVGTDFKKETQVYEFLTKHFSALGWKCARVETVDQDGFPDMLLLSKHSYLLIEAKLLHKDKLENIKDDLVWQFGQLATFARALTLELKYILVVGKHNQLAYIKRQETIK